MEQNSAATTLWRMWVDPVRRIVSFHEEKDCQLLEFRSHELFLNCVDQDAGRQFRYQYKNRGGISRPRRRVVCGKPAGRRCCVCCWPPP